MNSQRSLREILELVLARRYLVAGIALSIFFVGAIFSMMLPRVYESSTKVRVVDNKYLYGVYGQKLVGAKSGTERIRAIHQEMLSRNSIQDLVEELNLDRDLAGLPERERMEKLDALINGIKARTRIDLKETTHGEFIFNVAHDCSDPALAQRIVTHLSTSYQDRQYAERRQRATGALKAVQQKVTGTERDLKLAMDALASFEEAHPEHRFGRSDDTTARLEKEKERLRTVGEDIQSLELQLKNIDQQLAEEPEFKEVEEKVGNELTVERLREELDGLEQELILLKERYTDEHPKVIEKKKLIAAKKEKLKKAEQSERTVVKKVPNPVHAELKKSRLEVFSELTVKGQLRQDYEQRVQELSTLHEAFPELKRRWDALTRKVKDEEIRLEDLRDEMSSAEITYANNVAQNTLIFNVLDPPVYPVKPKSPNRPLIALVGLLLGLGAGVATVFVLDFFDHSFRYTEEVASAIDVPVLGSIAKIETLAEREAAKRRKRIAVAAVAALFLAAGAVAVLQMTDDGQIGSFLKDTVRLGG